MTRDFSLFMQNKLDRGWLARTIRNRSRFWCDYLLADQWKTAHKANLGQFYNAFALIFAVIPWKNNGKLNVHMCSKDPWASER